MVKTLHIIRRPDDPLALEAATYEKEIHEVEVLLLQDGVLSTSFPIGQTYVSIDDALARGVEPASACKPVHYDDICRLIIEASRVVVW